MSRLNHFRGLLGRALFCSHNKSTLTERIARAQADLSAGEVVKARKAFKGIVEDHPEDEPAHRYYFHALLSGCSVLGHRSREMDQLRQQYKERFPNTTKDDTDSKDDSPLKP